MKIGILTFHRAYNLGGILQCYALSYYLKKNLLNPEVIDYHSEAIDSAYKLLRFDSIRTFVGSLLRFRQNYKSMTNFKDFSLKFIPISKKSYKHPNELNNDYDVILIGSDQIWSKRLNHGFDPFFWGNISGPSRKIAYAASMGTDHCYTDDENKMISGFLKNFNAISVREDSLKDELSKLTDKIIETTIDPTLLLTIDDYREIAITPNATNYVLYYQMEYNPESKVRVAEVANELGCDVIVIGGKNEDYGGVKTTFITIADVTPQRFVGYILNAKCVFASSFHGVALSIAMRKDFYFFANYETDRADNLLKYVGLYDRRINSNEKISNKKVNYNLVENKIQSFVNASRDFLARNIKG